VPSIWGIFTVLELETAIGDCIGLIGDAVHSAQFPYNLVINTTKQSHVMTPHQGAGAGQAIEVSFIYFMLHKH